MLRVGVAGAAGSGKSTVTRLLAAQGIPVVNADTVAHDLYVPGSELVKSLVRTFGPWIRDDEGGIDRSRLGALVFMDPGRLTALNSLVHPPLLDELARRLDALEEAGTRWAVLEAALLLQWGPPDFIDLVVGVLAPRDVRASRLLATGLSTEAVDRRLDAQVTEGELEARAEILLDNAGTLEELETRVIALVEAIEERIQDGGTGRP